MNIQSFLSKVDEAANRSAKEQLAAFLHQYARTIPKAEREDFLSQLKAAVSSSVPQQREPAAPQDTSARLKDMLAQIHSGKLSLDSSLNEEYDDWYGDDEDFYRFEDPNGIIPLIEDAASAVSRHLRDQEYDAAYSLAHSLLTLDIHAEGEYTDYNDEPLSLEDLVNYELTVLDLRKLRHEAICAAYQCTSAEQRPAVIYDLFCSFGYGDETIEEAAQAGPEDLDNFTGFLRQWMEYLAAQPGRLAQRLLREAADLVHDGTLQLEVARKHVLVHPELYFQLLVSNPDGLDINNLLSLGKDALERIEPALIIRSEIALVTAEYALRLEQLPDAEECWLEALRSHTTVENLLRLCLESKNFPVYVDEVERICRSARRASSSAEDNSSYTTGLLYNHVSDHTYYALLFFLGSFDDVIRDGMNFTEPLGWSSTFMKTGLSLFLLLLYQGETLSTGGLALCKQLCETLPFAVHDYCKGLAETGTEPDAVRFWACFLRWKQDIPLSAETRRSLQERAEAWIQSRTAGILGATRRNYYGECAAYIAALGEVIESGGTPGAKQKTMEAYQSKYPRHSAFRQELVAFGLPRKRK